MGAAVLAARLVLSAVFAVAGGAKLADREGTAFTLEQFGLPRRLASAGAVLLPLAELAVAGLLLPDATAATGAVGAAVLLTVFIVGISVNLARGRRPDCNCFGQIGSAPVGPATLVRNVVLLALAAIVLAAGHGDAGAAALAGAGRLDTATALAGAALAVALAVLVLQVWLTFNVLGRHGRVLLRLDALDGGGDDAAARGPRMPAPLPVGAPAPAFELPSPLGETVRLQDLTGGDRPLAVVFVEPGCAPCEALLPELAGLQRDASGATFAVVVSRGDPDAAGALLGEHEVPLALIDGDGAVADAFHVFVTPSAIAVGADGLIRSAAVAGPDAVLDLLRRVGEDRDEGFDLAIVHVDGAGDGTPGIGQPVPDMQVEDLDGADVPLREAIEGDAHLLLFWSPTCRYCVDMLDAVRGLEARADVPSLLLIASGGADANREPGPAVADADRRLVPGVGPGARGRRDAVRRCASTPPAGSSRSLPSERSRSWLWPEPEPNTLLVVGRGLNYGRCVHAVLS